MVIVDLIVARCRGFTMHACTYVYVHVSCVYMCVNTCEEVFYLCSHDVDIRCIVAVISCVECDIFVYGAPRRCFPGCDRDETPVLNLIGDRRATGD